MIKSLKYFGSRRGNVFYLKNSNKVLLLTKRCSHNYSAVSGSNSFVNRIGTPQGFVVGSILSNIYLHEFDCFINESEAMKKFCKGRFAFANPKFASFFKFSQAELTEAENIKKTKGKRKHWKFLQKL